MKIMLIFMILLSASCSTPTQYVSSNKNKEGYSDRTIETDLRVTTFKGNSSTSREVSELYAKFRAIEICHEQKKNYTHIMVVKDKTSSKDVTETTAINPNYYYGVSPYYGRYGYGTGWGMGVGTTNYTTSTETYTYPMFEVYFECSDKPLDARISLNNLSGSQTTEFVKDLLGAVQVEEVLSDSPNVGKLEKGDIIIKAAGERVANVQDIYRVSRKFMQKSLKVEFFRNGVRREANLSFKDVTPLVAEAQKEIIKSACKQEGIKGRNALCKK